MLIPEYDRDGSEREGVISYLNVAGIMGKI